MSRPPTSRDLARLAGVSQATVSRVLTNNPKVNAETRARVLQVLKDANYTPNALARAMKTGRTDTIGVFMTRVTSPFHAELLDEIGRVFGISRERVRQIERESMSKLRTGDRSEALRAYAS